MSSQTNRPDEPTLLLDADPAARIVEVFRQDLQGVSFPDVSTETLEAAAEAVRERAAAVEALRKRVSDAQAELAAAKAELERQAQRGLAYAKVYAHGNSELTEKLARIHAADPPKRKRRNSARAERRPGAVAKQGKGQAEADTAGEPSLLSAVG